MLINNFTNAASSSVSDDYSKVLRRKSTYFVLMAVLGILMIIAATLNLTLHFAPNSEDTLNLYYGMGTGLTAVSLIKLLQNRRLLHSEALLKKARLKNLDERNLALTAKAMQGAATTVVMGCYLAMLIGGFYNIVLFWCFWSVIMLYALGYCIFLGYYRTKM